jgi:uncharacterized tellurite resistance protein B-like protein
MRLVFMLDRLAEFLSGRSTPSIGPGDETQLAVAALLVEAARMDGRFDAGERTVIEGLLAKKFELGPWDVQRLIERAQASVTQSTQYFPFTHAICRDMSIEERTQIIEMMWAVAYADGVLDPEEDMLLRQVAGLMHVPDHDRGLARQRALASAAARQA